MARFFRTSLAFLLGLAAALALFERVATRRVEATDGQSLIIRDVYRMPALARRPSADVRRVYLGDSVARQFYPAESEATRDARFPGSVLPRQQDRH